MGLNMDLHIVAYHYAEPHIAQVCARELCISPNVGIAYTHSKFDEQSCARAVIHLSLEAIFINAIARAIGVDRTRITATGEIRRGSRTFLVAWAIARH
jgi:hypothetical protein